MHNEKVHQPSVRVRALMSKTTDVEWIVPYRLMPLTRSVHSAFN